MNGPLQTSPYSYPSICRHSNGLSCVCLDYLPDPRHLGPDVFCDRVCQGMPCGGQATYENTSTDYYSLYCVDPSQGLMGVQMSSTSSGIGTPLYPHAGSHSTILHQITNLNTESVVIAGMLAAILVFLMLILVFMYFHKQVILSNFICGFKYWTMDISGQAAWPGV